MATVGDPDPGGQHIGQTGGVQGSEKSAQAEKTGSLGGRLVTWVKGNPIKAAIAVITGVIPALILKGAATQLSKAHRYLAQPGPKPNQSLEDELKGRYSYEKNPAQRILLSFDEAISGGDMAHHKPMIKLKLNDGKTVIGQWAGRYSNSNGVHSNHIILKVNGKKETYTSDQINDAVILPGLRKDAQPITGTVDPFEEGDVPRGLENTGIVYTKNGGVLDIPTDKYDVRAAIGQGAKIDSIYSRIFEAIFGSGNQEHIDIYEKGTSNLLYSIDVDSISSYEHPTFTVTNHTQKAEG